MADEEEARCERRDEHEDVGGAVDHDCAQRPGTWAAGCASEPMCSQEISWAPGHDVVARDRADDELEESADRERPLPSGDPPPADRLQQVKRAERTQSDCDSERVGTTNVFVHRSSVDAACCEQEENRARR